MEKEEKWLAVYLRPLIGATIESVTLVEDEDGYGLVFPVLGIRTADGETYEVEVSQDEEGNGPGFLHGLPTPIVTPEERAVVDAKIEAALEETAAR